MSNSALHQDGALQNALGADSAFSGPLPALVDPISIGAPYDLLRCFAPPELWAALWRARETLKSSALGNARSSSKRNSRNDGSVGVSASCHDHYHPLGGAANGYNPFESDLNKEARNTAVEANMVAWRDRLRTARYAEAFGPIEQLWFHGMPQAALFRLQTGELRAFGRRNFDRGPFEWVPRNDLRDGARALDAPRAPGGIVLNANGVRWWCVHVHDTTAGLPLDLAAIAYGPSEFAQEFMTALVHPAAGLRVDALRRELQAKLGEQLRYGPADSRAGLVRLPLPWTVDELLSADEVTHGLAELALEPHSPNLGASTTGYRWSDLSKEAKKAKRIGWEKRICELITQNEVSGVYPAADIIIKEEKIILDGPSAIENFKRTLDRDHTRYLSANPSVRTT